MCNEILRWILLCLCTRIPYHVSNLVLVKFVSTMFGFFLDWDIELRWNNLKTNIFCKIFAHPSICQQKNAAWISYYWIWSRRLNWAIKKCIHIRSLKSILRVLSDQSLWQPNFCAIKLASRKTSKCWFKIFW